MIFKKKYFLFFVFTFLALYTPVFACKSEVKKENCCSKKGIKAEEKKLCCKKDKIQSSKKSKCTGTCSEKGCKCKCTHTNCNYSFFTIPSQHFQFYNTQTTFFNSNNTKTSKGFYSLFLIPKIA